MVGNDRARVCPACTQIVYNVAELGRREIDRLISTYEGKPPCLRIFRRPDGTLVTRGCLAFARRAARLAWLRACAVAAVALGFWTYVALSWTSFRHWWAPARPVAASVAPGDTRARALAAEIEQRRRAIEEHVRDTTLVETGGVPRLDERPELPEPTGPARRLTKVEVVKALRPLHDEAQACAQDVAGHRLIPAEVVFQRSGRVRARVTGPLADSACARRLEAAARRIRVRRSDGLRTPYFFEID